MNMDNETIQMILSFILLALLLILIFNMKKGCKCKKEGYTSYNKYELRGDDDYESAYATL